MNKATNYIIPLLVVALTIYFWGGDKQRTATDAIANSETIKHNLSLSVVREKAIEKFNSNSEGLSELLEAAATVKGTQILRTPQSTAREVVEEKTIENPYSKAKQEKTLDSFFQEISNLFGDVSAATIGAFHLSKFHDYVEKTVPLLSSQTVNPSAEKGDNPYQRLIDDGALEIVLPNAEDPDAVAAYRKAKRENYLSKVR